MTISYFSLYEISSNARLVIIIMLIITLQSCSSNDKTPTHETAVMQLDTTTVSEPTDSIPSSDLVIITDYDTTLWTEILPSPTLLIDLKYATTDNFTDKQIYDCDRCFLRPHVADALDDFHNHLQEKYKLGIVLYDCYRPRPYQQKLWDIVPDRRYVTPPSKGSMHNRGMAIDIGLVDITGNILDMGSAFDHFGPKSFHSATDISTAAIANRKLMKSELLRFGFKGITSEWWHYSYRKEVMPLSDWVWECDF